MKTLYAALCLGLSLSAFAHDDWKKTVSDASIEGVQVVKVKSGELVTVRTDRSCLFGDDCVDGKHQFDVRLPYVSAPTGRQSMARDSYLSLKDLVLYRSLLLIPMSDRNGVMVGDLVTCKMSLGIFIKLKEPCELPEVLAGDVVKNKDGIVSLSRGGESFFSSTRIVQSEFPEIAEHYKKRPLRNLQTSEHEQGIYAQRIKKHATANVTMAFVSLAQAYTGMVYVDPKYTSFNSILFTAQDTAKLMQKGVWSLPESERRPPWEQ